MAKEKAKKKIEPLKKKMTAETFEIDFLELENRMECVERALAESIENLNECMKFIVETVPKVIS